MTTPAPKVLLAELIERTSAKGNTYLTGWVGKARIIGFWADGEDREGSPTRVLRLYVQEPEQKPQERQEGPRRQRHKVYEAQQRPTHAERAADAVQQRHQDAMTNLNDDIPF